MLAQGVTCTIVPVASTVNLTEAIMNGTSAITLEGSPRFVSAIELRAVLSVQRATDALARGFLTRADGELEGVPRTVLPVPDRACSDQGELLLMPAFGPEGAGVKLVSIARGNGARGLPLIQGLYVLLARDGLTPELVIDGAALTAIRTAAVSALATARLARPESQRLVVFGAGPQAAAHVEAIRATLPIDQVTIVATSMNSRRARALARALVADGIQAIVGRPSAVAAADVVCTCTTSTDPVFDDRELPAGVHINAIGAYRLDMCELPAASLSRALVVVENIEASLAEAGDLARAIEVGALPAVGFAHELADVLRGTIGRSGPEQVTIFKSVGLAVEDLMLARAVADALADESPRR
jgi:ornithine cyclodeaminase/alanine dehydrogenase-like protein (mu-crystallin family)